MVKILALCDSPTTQSGFARVAQNFFKVWHAEGGEAPVIDCWGIMFSGWGYRRCPYVGTLFPAGDGNWCTPDRLEAFLTQLQNGGYTHVWLMNDAWLLSQYNFPETLRKLCQEKGIHSTYYFPVDGNWEPEWSDIVAAVDLPIAYSEYGRREAFTAGEKRGHWPIPPLEEEMGQEMGQIEVLPHGVDTRIYRPLAERGKIREALWEVKWADPDGKRPKTWVGPEDFLMLNVNMNQRRKDVGRSLELLAAVRALGVPAKLVMHMPESSDGGLSLTAVARQLGLSELVEWVHHGSFFRKGHALIKEEALPKFYNVADLYLTTTLGEGWGLGMTEALACGCAVAAPLHTACEEIIRKVNLGYGELASDEDFGLRRMIGLPLEEHGLAQDHDNSRLRRRVDVGKAARVIKEYYESGFWQERPALPEGLEEWLDWRRIGRKMLRWMREGRKTAKPEFRVPAEVPPSPPEVEVPASPQEVVA